MGNKPGKTKKNDISSSAFARTGSMTSLPPTPGGGVGAQPLYGPGPPRPAGSLYYPTGIGAAPPPAAGDPRLHRTASQGPPAGSRPRTDFVDNNAILRRQEGPLRALPPENGNYATGTSAPFGDRRQIMSMPPAKVRDANGRAPSGDYEPQQQGQGQQQLPGEDPSSRSRPYSRRNTAPPSSGLTGPASRFLSTSEVKRRLLLFGTHVVQMAGEKFSTLTYHQQLAGLSVCICVTEQSSDVITLWDYVTGVMATTGVGVPADMMAARKEGLFYASTVPDALLLCLVEARCRGLGTGDEAFWQLIARDIFDCVVLETVYELTRMFEYQIAIAKNDDTVRLMADYAAACIVGAAAAAVTPTKARDGILAAPLDRNVALCAVVSDEVPPHGVAESISATPLTAIVQDANGRQQEVRWRLGDVFHKPGLRRESLLTSTGGLEVARVPAFRFYASDAESNDSFIYGYRGEFIEWDYVYCCYKLQAGEVSGFPEELADLPTHHDDPHRLYRPFNRLVGADAMKFYCRQTLSGKLTPGTSLAQVLREQAAPGAGAGGERDELRPVYRPVQGLQEATRGKLINFSSTQLDGADLIRCRIKRADWALFSAREAVLLWSELRLDCDPRKINGLGGANVSYSRLVTPEGDVALPNDITAIYVTLQAGSSASRGSTLADDDQQQQQPSSSKMKMITNDKQQILLPSIAIEEKQKAVEEAARDETKSKRRSGSEKKEKKDKTKKKKRKSATLNDSQATEDAEVQDSPKAAEEQPAVVLRVSTQPLKESSVDAPPINSNVQELDAEPGRRRSSVRSRPPSQPPQDAPAAVVVVNVKPEEQPVITSLKRKSKKSSQLDTSLPESDGTDMKVKANAVRHSAVEDRPPAQPQAQPPAERQAAPPPVAIAIAVAAAPPTKPATSENVQQLDEEPGRRRSGIRSSRPPAESVPVNNQPVEIRNNVAPAVIPITRVKVDSEQPIVVKVEPSTTQQKVAVAVQPPVVAQQKHPVATVTVSAPSKSVSEITVAAPAAKTVAAQKPQAAPLAADEWNEDEPLVAASSKQNGTTSKQPHNDLTDGDVPKKEKSKRSKSSDGDKTKKKKKKHRSKDEHAPARSNSPPMSSVSAPSTPGGTRRKASLAAQEDLDSSGGSGDEFDSTSRPTSPFSDVGVGTRAAAVSAHALPTSWAPLKAEKIQVPVKPRGAMFASVTPGQRAQSANNVSAEATTKKSRSSSTSKDESATGGGLPSSGTLTTWRSQQYQLSGRAPTDMVNRSLMSARSFLSMAELESLRKSQVFAITKELQIKQTPTNLPMTQRPLFGRQGDIDAVAGLLAQPQRLVVMTGCPGIGKASLAQAVAARLATDHLVVPFVVDARGAPTCDGILRRLLRVFGVRFRLREMTYFCNWLNAQEQSPLFVINNVDVAHDESAIFSDMLDRLAAGVKGARILCTSGRNFFTGKTACSVYRVADLGPAGTKRVILSLAPDLHEEGVDELTLACNNVLLGVYLTAKACVLPDVDPGQLFVDVTTMDNGVLDPAKVWDVAGLAASDDDTRRKLAKVMGVIERVIVNLPTDHQTVLEMMSVFACYFDVTGCTYVTGLPEKSLTKVLKELVDTGFLLTEPHKNKTRYYVEGFVKLVARAMCIQRRGEEALLKYCAYFTTQLTAMSTRFWSPNVSDVVSDFDDNYDNFVDVIENVIDRDALLTQMSGAASIESVIFYSTVLPDKLFLVFYDALAQVADSNSDVQTMADALCALSYYYAETGKPDRARSFALRAFELMQAAPASLADRLDKTFCWQCLGRALWHEAEEKTRALMLLKQSQEVTHATRGVRHLKTLIANEFYAALLTHTDNFQMARHYYNISDMALRQLSEHPFFLPGFECRRIIWDKLGLIQRSTEMTHKSAIVAQRYHADHPLTATAYARYSDCLLRQGEVQESIRACVTALNIRTRVLGHHADTAASNRTLAKLLLKVGQPDESLRYCDMALEIYEKLHADEALKLDIRNIMAQAHSRQMALMAAAARAQLTNGYTASNGTSANVSQNASMHDGGNDSDAEVAVKKKPIAVTASVPLTSAAKVKAAAISSVFTDV